MSAQESQSKKLGNWKKGRDLSAKNFQESVDTIRSLQKTITTPQQVTNQSKGFSVYRVTEVVDLALSPVTWTIKAVMVSDALNSEEQPVLEAISNELTMKLHEGTYGVAVGDLVTKAIGKKDPYSVLVVPISNNTLVYKASADESGGEITGKAMKLDLTTIGDEQTFKTFPDA